MTGVYLDQEFTIAAGDTETMSIDCTPHLDSGETISSVDTVEVDSGPSGSTISNKAANTAAYTDAYRGTTVAIGKAVTFKIATSSTTGTYDIKYTVTTSGGRSWTRHVIIHAE